MKLSAKEIEIFSQIEKNKKWRRINAWINLVSIPVILYIASLLNLVPPFPMALVGTIVGFTVANLANVYFGVRSEDKLIDLLQRYVNRDPEAISQMSEASGTSEPAV
jgi:hypothetical protein